MALTLFKDGFSETYEAYGFYTYQDFYQFGQRIGIKASRVKGIIQEFNRSKKIVQPLINRSSLSRDTKVAYRKHYEDKIKRLGMNTN